MPVASFYDGGKIKGVALAFGPYQWLLGSLSTILIAYVLAAFFSKFNLEAVFEKIKSRLEKLSLKFVCLLLASFFVFLNFISYYCFNHKPHLIDTIAQLFQAKIFSKALLKAPVVEYPEFFMTQHMIFDSSGWYSQYPLGHQLLLMPGVILNMPWLTNIVLTLITVYFAYKIAFKVYGRLHANITLILLIFCPFLFFMGASYMNHVSALSCVTLFAYFYFEWLSSKNFKFLLYAAIFMGYGMTIRPLTILALSIPFIIYAFIFARENKIIKHLFKALPVGLIYLVLIGLYNYYMYGDYKLLGYVKLWGEGHGLGFHVSPWGGSHTPFTGLRNEITELYLLNEFLFEWPVPVTLVLGLYLLFVEKIKKEEKLFLCSFLMLPFAYFFYWHRDAFLGPRFLYEGVVFLVLISSSALIFISKKISKFSIGYEGILKPVGGRSFYLCFVFILFAYSIFVSMPATANVYSNGMNSLKLDISDFLEKRKINKALVFVKVSWGVRIMSQLRSLGVPASKTQILYENSDHCELFTQLRKQQKNKEKTSDFILRLNSLIRDRDTDKLRPINGHVDYTIRIASGSILTEECRKELFYDMKVPFGVYNPFLNKNQVRLNGDFIFAMDMIERNTLLMNQYKDYPAYIYYPNQLIKLN